MVNALIYINGREGSCGGIPARPSPRVMRSRPVSPGTVDGNTRPPIIRIELGEQPVTSNNVTRVDLYEAVYQKAGLSRSGSLALVELVLKEITDTLAKGETVKLSSFGSFLVRRKKQRLGRNPKTGIEAPISPRRVIVFKASAILKQQINEKRPGAVNILQRADRSSRTCNSSRL